LQAITAEKNGETAEKITRELNEVLAEARADKAHGVAVSAIATKAKILNIGEQQTTKRIDFNTANSMQEIGCKLLQSIGFAEPDDVSIAEAVELNNGFVRGLEAIHQRAQQRLIEHSGS
jgi:hypothetical protein